MKPITTPKSQWTGFTLVELLVVIAIVGVVAALLFPAISKAKSKARRIQCVSNLRQIGIGLQSFLASNHAYPSWFSGKNEEHSGAWNRQIETGGFDLSKPRTNFWAAGIWRCPSARWGTWLRPGGIADSYGYNAYGVLPRPDHVNPLGLHGRLISKSSLFAPVAESEVLKPSEMIAIGDSFTGGLTFVRDDLGKLEKLGFASSRHEGKVNIVFCDGHVESSPLKAVFVETGEAELARWNRDHQPHRDRL
jgi:prepilin-type processing-associated H-X9-DG protein/prepilin-type N-terminal cleavage/methylation domain-containing protein